MPATPEHPQSLASVLRVVGKPTFDRGRRYTRDEMVDEFSYDPAEMTLFGTVLGSGRSDYQTTVYVTVAFLGAPAHCVAYLDRIDDSAKARIGLARLDSPVSVVAQRLLLTGMAVPIPASDADRFAAAY